MSQYRLDRVNSLIQRELSQFFNKELEFPESALVTITEVETNVDIDEAKIWISVFPFGAAKKVLSFLNKKIGFCQQFLNKKLKMHFVPKISFSLDEIENQAGEIEDLLNKISK